MDDPKKDNSKRGVKSYKNLWFSEILLWCFIPVYFWIRWIMRDPDWVHGRAFGHICILYGVFVIGIVCMCTYGLVDDYKSLVRRGKTEHKPWKLASIMIVHILNLLISSYILFIYH